jgi:hypothetical protein
VAHVDRWQEGLENALLAIGIDPNDAGPSWFSWRAGLVAMIASATAVLLFQSLTFAWRGLGAWWHSVYSPPARRRRQIVAFYVRLEKLLADLDIVRAPSQTQREFAGAAAQRLAALGPRIAPAADVPTQIVDAFYRVRFGQSTLDNLQTEAIEQGLSRLEGGLKHKDSPRSEP